MVSVCDGLKIGLASLFVISAASAQDAGVERDAGLPMSMPSDGGMLDGSDAVDGGPISEGSAVEGCSCETDQVEGGRIHICTGSADPKVCASFSCEEAGIVRNVPCPSDNVRSCCELSDGYYAQLYEDCTHPSCESGFERQCDSFDGTLSSGRCPDVPTGGGDNGSGGEDGGTACAIAAVGAAGHAGVASAMAAAGLIALVLRRRARARARAR